MHDNARFFHIIINTSSKVLTRCRFYKQIGFILFNDSNIHFSTWSLNGNFVPYFTSNKAFCDWRVIRNFPLERIGFRTSNDGIGFFIPIRQYSIKVTEVPSETASLLSSASQMIFALRIMFSSVVIRPSTNACSSFAASYSEFSDKSPKLSSDFNSFYYFFTFNRFQLFQFMLKLLFQLVSSEILFLLPKPFTPSSIHKPNRWCCKIFY